MGEWDPGCWSIKFGFLVPQTLPRIRGPAQEAENGAPRAKSGTETETEFILGCTYRSTAPLVRAHSPSHPGRHTSTPNKRNLAQNA